MTSERPAGASFNRSRFSPVPTNRGKAGQPTLCKPEITERIVKNLAAGSYVVTACEAAGVAYGTVRAWITRAASEKMAGKKTRYTEFADKLAQAEYLAEQALVTRLNVAEDWRAQSFLLERRWRERWGKNEVPIAPTQVLVIQADTAPAILEALRAARARGDNETGPITDVMSTIPNAENVTIETEAVREKTLELPQLSAPTEPVR